MSHIYFSKLELNVNSRNINTGKIYKQSLNVHTYFYLFTRQFIKMFIALGYRWFFKLSLLGFLDVCPVIEGRLTKDSIVKFHSFNDVYYIVRRKLLQFKILSLVFVLKCSVDLLTSI